MKTHITRIGLMTLALATSLTAVGQVTDQQLKKMNPNARAESNTRSQSLSLEAKKSSASNSLRESDNDSRSRQDQRMELQPKSPEKSQDSLPSLREMGGVNGGGGSQVTVDGKTSLSDRYYQKIGKPLTFQKAFPQQLQNYVQSTLRLLNAYGINTTHFYSDTIAASNNLYVFVTPQEFIQLKCEHYLPKLNRPVDHHEQFGCHIGRTTYMIQEYFYSPGANILDQSLRIIHERLWVLNPDVDQRFIVDFTTPLGQLKAMQDAQIFHGDRSTLTDEQVALFEDLEIAARQLGFSAPENLSAQIIRQGGGRKIGNVSMDEKSFVGIGSAVSEDSLIQNSTLLGNNQVASSTVQNSQLFDSAMTGASVENSTLKQSSLMAKAKVENSVLESVTTSAVITNSQVSHTTVGEKVNLDQAIVKDSQLEVPVIPLPKLNVSIQFAKIQGSTVSLYSILGTPGQLVTIQDSKIYGDLIWHGFMNGRYSVPTIEGQTKIVNSELKKGGMIGSNVEITNVIYAASDKEFSKSTMPGIEVTSSSGLRNLNYTYEYKSKFWDMGVEFQVDTKGQILDFGGKVCTSHAEKLKIQTANDLLQHCR